MVSYIFKQPLFLKRKFKIVPAQCSSDIGVTICVSTLFEE